MKRRIVNEDSPEDDQSILIETLSCNQQVLLRTIEQLVLLRTPNVPPNEGLFNLKIVYNSDLKEVLSVSNIPKRF